MLPLSIDEIYSIFIKITEEILPIYKSESIDVKKKKDDSPVTRADLISNELLIEYLTRFGIPIISEETKTTGNSRNLEWVIDPLDGTKDFIDKTGEFSILVSLLSNNKPIKGYVYLPVKKVLYFASYGNGAYVFDGVRKNKIHVSKRRGNKRIITVSRNHPNENQNLINKTLGIKRIKPSGSLGIKLALIAEGAADIYLHTEDKLSIWDTAAGDILLREAGGLITDVNGKSSMYNRKNLRHRNGVLATNSIDHAEIIKALN